MNNFEDICSSYTSFVTYMYKVVPCFIFAFRFWRTLGQILIFKENISKKLINFKGLYAYFQETLHAKMNEKKQFKETKRYDIY